jgi:prepilin-type N-terminal cleavage/methylation domain-containing protein
MRKKSSVPSSPAGFTLIELLIAIAVLTLLVVMVAQITKSATDTTVASGKHMDSDSQARIIFDRMANDFAGMVKRQDVDYVFAKQTGNDTMFFYSRAPAYFDTSPTVTAKGLIALVGYRINTSFQLERLGKGLTWDGTSAAPPAPGGMVFLTTPAIAGTTPTPGTTPFPASTLAGNWSSTLGAAPGYNSGTDTDYHVLSDQTYRMEITFLLKDGTLSNTPYIAPNTSINGFKDVSAVVVALGLLDATSRTILLQNNVVPTTTGNLMIAALPEAVDGTPIAQTWGNSSYLTTSGIPQAAQAHLRIYQRYFYLDSK